LSSSSKTLNTTIIEKNADSGNPNGEGNANGEDPSNNAISFVKMVIFFLLIYLTGSSC